MLPALRHRLRVLRLVHLRELRLHPLRTLIAVISVAAGVSMVLSVFVVVEATTASFERQAEALAGPAPLRAVGSTSDGGLLPGDIETIAATDGVAGVTALVRGIVQFERPDPDGGIELSGDGLVLGLDCAAASVLGIECDDLTAGQVVTPAVADRANDGVALRSGAGPIAIEPVAIAETLVAVGPRVVAVSTAEAQRLFGRGEQLDVAFIVPQPTVGVAEVQERLDAALPDGVQVLAATDPPPEFAQVLATIVPLFGLIGIVALGIGTILVANTIALSLEERRLQLAVVGALGGTGAHIVSGALLQAALLGVAGGLIGTGGAVLLAGPLTDSVTDFTLSIAGVVVDESAADPPIVIGVVLGALVAAGASWRPARRAQRSDVAAELSKRERRAEADTSGLAARALFVVAIGLVGVGMAAAGGADGSLQSWQPLVGIVGLLVAILGLFIGMGRVTALLASWLLRSVTPRNASLRLALANLSREPSRTGVMAIGIGAAVGTAFLVASFNESSRAGIIDGISSESDEEVAVSIGERQGNEDVFFDLPPSVVEAIAARPDVERAARGIFVFTSSDDASLAIQGTENELRGPRVYDGVKDQQRFLDGEVMIGAAVARSQGIGAGDMVEIPVHDGVAELPVMGVWANGNAVGNSVTMTYDKALELFGPRPVDGLSVTPAPGVDSEALAAAIQAESPDPGVRAETFATVADRVADSVNAQLAPFWALQRGLTAVAFIAVLSTMLLVAIQRTRELGLLAAVGMEPRALGGMILLEAAIVGVLATVVAGALTVLMSLALSALTPLIIGWENPIRFALGAIPLYGAITVVLAVLGALLPAWRASRLHVVEALAYE